MVSKEQIKYNITQEMKNKTWLSARMIQRVGKQASGVVRGTVQKHKQRLHVLNNYNRSQDKNL